MTTPKVSEFMLQLAKDLMDQRKIAESTANAYVKTLYLLNGKLPFKTLSFLRKKDDILAKVKEYADATQKSILASIVSVLTLYREKPTYKSVYNFYYDEMMGKTKALKENGPAPNEKTEKQKENWISWEEVQTRVKEFQSATDAIAKKKSITESDYEKLLHYVLLALYTYTQPRRNQDYLDMMIVKKWNDTLPTTHNYLDMAGKQFVFNKYKTAKKYGTQKVEIPNTEESPLFSLLTLYTKHHPLYRETKGKEPVPLLVNADGKPQTAGNFITRVLNRIFGKKVGSSMLRHIYLTDKYGKVLEEQKEDSAAMGHSVNQQRDYIKNGEPTQ